MLLAGVVALALPLPALAQTSAREAGSISAMVPVDHVLRQKKGIEAVKDMKVLWGDKVVTERGGRVRVRLNDGSILNVGSQSSLEILQHDTQTQRTQLQLAYGRMRASVVRITQPDGGFQVRTTAAVAGVVGTDIFTEAAQIYTTVIALGGGFVTVGSPNPLYAAFASTLNPGEAITLIADQRPGEKRLATNEELGNAFQETELDEVVRLDPRATFPGHTFQGRIAGQGLAAATAVSFAREGISIEMTGPATPTGIPVSVTVAEDVPHGTYPFTVQRPQGSQVGVLIVTSEENVGRVGGAGGGRMKPPAAQTITATRGAKFALDASATETPAGTSIAAFLWKILDTDFSSNQAEFTVNTSLLPPGDYVIQLAVVNDRGQAATQRYNLTVEPGIQPAEIISELATGYESLQPNQFLRYFDEEKFRNYSGFAAAIEDSFRNQLETVRVFQRPVNCTITEEEDQAACQADFELQFTKKDQPTEPLDANGNPFPPGVSAPANATPGKRQLTGTERSTIRFERADQGWKIVDYSAEVSCPGGAAVSGVNVGSCILALGSSSTPDFQITNVLLPGGAVVPVGGTLTGTFDLSPLGGFNGAITLTGVADVGGTPATLTFSPNPAPPLGTVTFTVSVPVTGPNATTPFTLTITGVDSSGAITQSASIPLTYQGLPPFALSQFTNPNAPLTLLANSSVVIGITAMSSVSGFNTPITLTFGPLPSGVTVSPATANVLPGSTQPFTFTFTPAGNAFANFGVANVTVTGTAAGVPVQTSTIVLNLGTAGSLPFSLFSSPSTSTVTLSSPSLVNTGFNVFVSSAQTFNQPINISMGTPPPGVTISPSTFVFTPGLSGSNVFYTVTVNPAVAQPGSYPVLVSGVSGGVSATTTWTLNINGAFSLSVAPNNTQLTPMVLPPDGVTQTNVTVTVTSINNFSGSVNVLFFSPFNPPGITVSPSNSQTVNVSAGGTANVVFTLVALATNSSTATTSAFINASSTSGTALNSISGPFMTIGPAGFSLSPPSSFNIADINSTFGPTVITTVQPLGAFGASADFTVVSGTIPAGVTISPLTQTVAAGGQARFTVRAASPAVVGNYAITVNAVSGALSQTYTINLRLRGRITLNVTETPGGGPPGTQTVPLVLAPSGTLTFNVSVGGADGFSGSVELQAFNLPGGVTAVFTSSGSSTAFLNAPGSDTLTLTNTSAAAAPLLTSYVQAFDPVNGFSFTSPNQQIFYTTGGPTFVLGCTYYTGYPATPCNQISHLYLNINQSYSTDSLNLKLDAIGGYSGTVRVTPIGLPAGMTMSPNPVVLSPGTPVAVTFSAATPAVAGLFNFTLEGIDTVNSQLISVTPVSGQMNGSIKLVVTPATTQNLPAIVAPGGQQVFSVDVTGMNGFSGTANINLFPSLATGVTIAPSGTQQVTVPSVGSLTLTYTVSAAANAPASFTHPITFDADGFDQFFNNVTYFVSGETSVSSLYVVGPSSFNTFVSGATLTNPLFVQVGQQASIFTSINAIGAFNGTVFLDVVGLPSSITVSSAPGSSATIPVRQGAGTIVIQPQVAGVGVPGTSASATLFFTVASNAPRGFVQGTLTATAGALVQSIPIVFFVTPQVTLNLTPAASTTAPMVIAPGSSANLQIAANASPSFAGDVDLSFSLPSGVTITPVSVRATLGGFTTVSVSLANSVAPGSTLSIGIFAYINGSFVSQTTATIIAGAGAFGITITPNAATSSSTPLVINAGSSGIVGVTVSAIGTFSGNVTVDATFTVATLSTPTPSVSVAPGGTANFTVNAAAGAQGLIARMFITATGGGQSTSAIVFISIGAGGFSLTVVGNTSSNPMLLDLPGTNSFSVLVHQQSGFTGIVSLVASGLPAGVTVPNNNFLVAAGTQQTFVVQVASNAAAGDTQFTLTGTSGALSVNVTVFLRLRGRFSLSLSGGASPTAPVVIAPGGSQNVSVVVVPVASSFGNVTITASTFNLPTGVTVSPSSATVAPNTPAQFTISVAANTPGTAVFSFSFFASGTYISGGPGASVFASVASNPTFNMGFFSPTSVDIGNQYASSLYVTLTPVGGYSGTVTLSSSSLPSGVTVTPASTTVALSGFGTSVNLNFVASTAAFSAGSFPVNITATDGVITLTQQLQVDVLADFSMAASAGTNSTAPILLAAGGSTNVNIPITLNPANILCNDSTYTISLSTSASLPTGVTAGVTATANASTPGVLNVAVPSGTSASSIFGVTVIGDGPPGCAQTQRSVTSYFVIGPGSFSLSVPTFVTAVGINTNSLASVGMTVNSIGNFQGTVNVSVVGASVPTGVTVTPATAAVAAGNSLNFQVRADSPATAGSTSFNITATDGVTTLNGTIPLLLRGSYTLTISPANSNSQPAVVAPNQSLTYTVTVNPQNGFNGTVNISHWYGSPPPGVSITSNLTASPGSPGQIVVTASSTAAPSMPQVAFFLSSSPNSFSAPGFGFFSAAGPPGFRVTNFSSVNFPQQVVINGFARNITVDVQSLGGFTGLVNLALGSLPAGLTASPQTAQVNVPAGGIASFTFSFLAGSQLSQGPLDVQLTASQGATSVNTFFYLYAASNMALVQSPPTNPNTLLRLIQNDPIGQTLNIQVLNQGGFTGSLQLAVQNLPVGITVNPMTATVPANGNANFQITAGAGAANGSQSFDITASFSGLFASSPVFLNVGVGSFSLTGSPNSTLAQPIALNPNGTSIVPLAVTATGTNGFQGIVDITPTGLPAGMTATPATAQVTVPPNGSASTTFSFTATVAQGANPVTITLNGVSNVATPAGPVAVNASMQSFFLVNPPTFALTQTGGTSGSPLSIEQGIPPGQTFTIGVTGAGTVTITFANLPSGITISPPTANIAAGSAGTFSVVAASNTAIGNYIISVVGASGGQLAALNLFVNVVVPTNGFFLTTVPPTSAAAPVILQPDHTLTTFLNINVLGKGTFNGTVNLSLTGVPAGVIATLTPTSADLSLSPVQVVQLQFQTTTGLAGFGPSIVSVDGVSGALTASTPVFVALQIVSAIQQPGAQTIRAPEILQVLPPGGYAGSHMTLTLQGSGLSGITQVLSGTTKISAQLDPGTDSMRRLSVFVRPETPEGTYTLMLVSPHGSVPVGINVATESLVDTPDGPGRDGRPTQRSSRVGSRLPGGGLSPRAQQTGGVVGEASRPVVTGVEPASLKPGDAVVGRLLGENLQGVRAVRANGLGISVEVLEARATEVRVRFIVAGTAASGARMLALFPGGHSADAMLEIQAARVAAPATQASASSTPDETPETPESRTVGTRPADTGRGVTTSSASAAPPDLVVRSGDITMSPGSPRPGDNVTFRVQMTNRGGQNAENVEVEFTLGGANVRVRERFSIAAGSSQSFQVEWQALGSGRFEPRVVIDPERRLNLTNRATTVAALPAFEMFPALGAAGRTTTAMRERGQLSLTANGCQGFRFSSGTEQACNGGADIEVRLAPQGGALRIEADGVRNLGAIPLEQAGQVPRGAMATAETVLPGAVYLVETRRGAVLVRVMDVRGLNAARAATPPALNRPRLSDVEGPQAAMPQNSITLVLEWRPLAQ
ncbi:MAG: FecR domain-containing protein [Acidobacteria bacterium]|nr:FecR domain-containing protein [Acidobacteriota bacterium]